MPPEILSLGKDPQNQKEKEIILFRKEFFLPEPLQKNLEQYFHCQKIFLEQLSDFPGGKPEIERIVDENGEILAWVNLKAIEEMNPDLKPSGIKKIAQLWLSEDVARLTGIKEKIDDEYGY